MRVFVCVCVRDCVRVCMCKTSCKQLGEIELSRINFKDKCCIFVYNHECMLQINHIVGQSNHHLGMVRSFRRPLSLMLKLSG